MTTATFDQNDGVIYAKKEATFGTLIEPAAGDALRYINFRPQIAANLIDNPEAGVGRTRQKPVRGRESSTWQLDATLRPANAANARCELDVLLDLAFGASAVASDDASVDYTLAGAQEASASIWFDSPLVQEGWSGCAVETMVMSWSGQGLTNVQFTGRGRGVARAVAFVATSTAAKTLAAPSGVDARDLVGVGNILSVGGTKVVVEEVTASQITFDKAAAAATDGDIVSALADPAFGTQGESLYGTQGSVMLKLGTADAVPVRVLTGSFTLNTGVQFIDNEYGEPVPRAVASPGQRTVDLSMTMNVQAADLQRLSAIERRTSYAGTVIFGPSDGRRFELSMPEVTFAPSSPERQTGQFSTMTLAGQATSETENAEAVLKTK